MSLLIDTSDRSQSGTDRRTGWSSALLTLAQQLGLVLLAALTYFGVRGLTEGSAPEAVAHAHTILDLESALGIDLEAGVQSTVIDHHRVVTLANWVYIWGHWPLIAATLVWLHHTRRHAYFTLRNAMFVSGAIGLVVFALYPVAPPRLAGLGFVDTVTERAHSYRVLQPPALVNKYAAVPSLHVGWNFLVGLIGWRHARSRQLRLAAAMSPVLMYAAVVLTANHFVIDGVVGIAIAGAGLAITRFVETDGITAGTTVDPAVREAGGRADSAAHHLAARARS